MRALRQNFCRLVFCALFATTIHLHAQHYPAGCEGIQGASLPPPGLYLKNYDSFYFFNQTPGYVGQSDGFDYTQSPRLIWMANRKLIGADYGMAVRVPFAYKQITHSVPPAIIADPVPMEIPGTQYTQKQFGLEDIQVEPILLSWHLKQFDISTGYSFWAPTGAYNKDQITAVNLGRGYYQTVRLVENLGNGYWTQMIRFGVTWYLDEAKTWAVSLLNHYEINTRRNSGTYTAPSGETSTVWTTLGNIYTLEWAVSKTVIQDLNVGLTGYYQQQVTDTQIPSLNGIILPDKRIDVAGIGPEIIANFPRYGLVGSLRYAYEFTAMNHPQGNLITLTFTKSF